MTYAHWKTRKHDDLAVFELFFRKNPFPNGEYTVLCGLDECLRHLQTFEFTQSDIEYLKQTPALQQCEPEFFDYLKTLSCKELTVHAPQEGTIVFPKIPLLSLKGPLGVCQLLETTLLNLINYPSLVATNASRMVIRAQPHPCIEFGLRRAQGPDGAMSASKYSFVGGFTATSNVLAGKSFGIPIAGTHAHSYVQSFVSLEEVANLKLRNKTTTPQQDQLFVPAVLSNLQQQQQQQQRQSSSSSANATKSTSPSNSNSTTTNMGELAAFCAYACAFPDSCLCLIDTYDTLRSGLPNFVAVALTLQDFGYKPKGVRLDSGDLAKLSRSCRDIFDEVGRNEPDRAEIFRDLTIIASNDINEQSLVDLKKCNHALTAFGIGTNLVTCQAQPALGCVYKLVECSGRPRIKLSQEISKMTMPGQKVVYRLYGLKNKKASDTGGEDDDVEAMYVPIVDYMALADEEPPKACGLVDSDGNNTDDNGGIVCRHPFKQQHRLIVRPAKVECLHSVVFKDGQVQTNQLEIPLKQTRAFVQDQLLNKFPSTLTDYDNPTPYQVMVSLELYNKLHQIWEQEAPMEEFREHSSSTNSSDVNNDNNKNEWKQKLSRDDGENGRVG
eukprot:CAMPEP_0113494104 /NCGR_PEP_ID=MMETSP0014_2-20120614/28936_1 /TAXON_ID=2857 /ORGANISM="Nitzschia sp." /LENGTH=610 /DNA_ID=CAMNT_0000387989 /DNA_START=347 /DNA_END=2176 /DNA_ORIENTATION=- /assembly_acc=CAM_ASM_000159